MELFTRYFTPSKNLIMPLLQYVSEHKDLNVVRQNLLRFAECYYYLDRLSEDRDCLEHLGYLQSRHSAICGYEL